MDIGEMKERRLALGLTIEQLAARVGVTPAAVSRWEQGKRKPHRITLRAWEEALGVEK